MESSDSAFAKLKRGVHHVEALKEEVAAFRGRLTYRIDRQGNLDDGDDRLVWIEYVFREIEPIPVLWADLLGDALYNLRSALDHMIWALSVRHSGIAPPNARAIMFPIFDTEKRFVDGAWQALGAIDHVTVSARLGETVPATVQRLQPFNDDVFSAHEHPLWLLRGLNNLDKHQAIHVVRRWVVDFDVQFPVEPPGLTRVPFVGDVLHDGAVLQRLTFRRPPRRVEMDVRSELAYVETIAETGRTPTVPLRVVVAIVEHVAVAVGALAVHLE